MTHFPRVCGIFHIRIAASQNTALTQPSGSAKDAVYVLGAQRILRDAFQQLRQRPALLRVFQTPADSV
jgi:hypothetical protein